MGAGCYGYELGRAEYGGTQSDGDWDTQASQGEDEGLAESDTDDSLSAEGAHSGAESPGTSTGGAESASTSVSASGPSDTDDSGSGGATGSGGSKGEQGEHDNGDSGDGGDETSGSGDSAGDDSSEACNRHRSYWRQHHAEATSHKKQIPWPIAEDTEICDTTWLSLIWLPEQGVSWRALAQAWIVTRLNLASGVDGGEIDAILVETKSLVDRCELEGDEQQRATELTAELNRFIDDPAHICGGIVGER